MPTKTTSALFSLRSAISWAIRVRARRKAAELRITVDSGIKKAEPAQRYWADSTVDIPYSLPWRPLGIALKGLPENGLLTTGWPRRLSAAAPFAPVFNNPIG